jgi:hypothetical protein
MHAIRHFIRLCRAAFWMLLIGLTLPAGAQATGVRTWDIFGGGVYQRSITNQTNAHGWEASLTERPYADHNWIGGTIEGGGYYNSSHATTSTTSYTLSTAGSDSIYTLMAGPVVTLVTHRIHPFARLLLGGVYEQTLATAANGSISVSQAGNSTYFGLAAGGGLDFTFNSSWGVRVQADYLRTYASSTYPDTSVRAAAGLVYSF